MQSELLYNACQLEIATASKRRSEGADAERRQDTGRARARVRQQRPLSHGATASEERARRAR
eukprot:5858093-Alexandrium_andersonii.AAC.1